MNTQLVFELSRKLIDKYIYNNETNKETIDKTNKNTIRFILTIKKLFSDISNRNSKTFCDLSSLLCHELFTSSSLDSIKSNKANPINRRHE